MKEIPILFSTPMVQALLAGRKKQTRRIMKPQPPEFCPFVGLRPDNRFEFYDRSPEEYKHPSATGTWPFDSSGLKCPYGQPGDLLWVRESFREIEQDFGWPRYEYKATETINLIDRWKPSIHMPKAAARIWLRVKNVRVERLHDISEADAIAEGAKDHLTVDELKLLTGLGDWNIPSPFGGHQFGFMSLWCQINGCESWLANPWLWVVEFEVISTTGKTNL